MRTPVLSSFQSRYSPSDKRNLNSFRWPNVFLMQPRDLCCCQSVSLIGMPGCQWAADGDREKVAKINRRGRDITHLIKSVLTETTERAAAPEVQKTQGARLLSAAGQMSPVCSNVHWMKQYGLTSEAIYVIETIRRRVNFSLRCGSVQTLLIVCMFSSFGDLLWSQHTAIHHGARVTL